MDKNIFTIKKFLCVFTNFHFLQFLDKIFTDAFDNIRISEIMSNSKTNKLLSKNKLLKTLCKAKISSVKNNKPQVLRVVHIAFPSKDFRLKTSK